MMKKIWTILLVLVFTCSMLFIVTSCAKRQVGFDVAGPTIVPTIAPPAPAPAAVPPKVEQKTVVPEQPDTGKLQQEIRAFESEHIYFDYDKADLRPEARAILDKKAAWLKANPDFSVRIEGHCDERGTNEYNLALGERRADAALKYLNALGLSDSRMDRVSFGEERPAVMGRDERAWSKNRRDEFKLMK